MLLAPPGSGKTTLVPPTVADLVKGRGRVIVTQPRRIAVRAAARRLASLLGEPLGQTVGYAVRGDRQSGPSTRIEFVTTGLLLRRLQAEPDLPGVAAVVLDEVHERQLDGDLTLALLVDVRAALREDLVLVAMSATIEAKRTAAALGRGAAAVPVVDVPGALHPVEDRWSPLPPGVKRMDDRGVTPRFLDHVAATARRALSEGPGDVLVFCPGAREVDGVVRRLSGSAGEVDIRPLHGRLPANEQDSALSAGKRRRVIVSTAVAESSLTVLGVRSVVDAGLSREPRTDHRRGLAGLVTVRVSRSSAEQRAGRAGRQGPGTVYRCWSAAEHAHLEPHPAPEIATADLTGFALELATWGSPDGSDLALLDPPPAAAMTIARDTLLGLGAVGADGVVTARGRLMASVPVEPRLARGLLDGAPVVGARRAAEIVALLAEDLRAPGADLVATLRSQRRGGPESGRWRTTRDRLVQALPRSSEGSRPSGDLSDDLAVGAVVALAYPERIAHRRPGGTTYLMVGGTGAALARGESSLVGVEWLAVADIDRRPGATEALIRSAAPIDEDIALDAATARWSETEEVRWRDRRIVARRVTRLGAIELASMNLDHPDPALIGAAVREGLAREGLGVLRWNESAVGLRRRLAFLRRAVGEPWPDVSDTALLGDLEVWLGPNLATITGVGDLRRVDVLHALKRLLPWPTAGRLDELAPERIVVPSGSSVRVDYEPEQPVLAVKLQEAFGWVETPRLADGRVPLLLHLLSPARRPLAVTADLASFWDSAYPAVRSEMRGRYPKHPWPEDPWSAPAQRGVKKRP